MHCENHYFAFQKYGFYTAKVGILCSKTPTFAMPNGNYRFCKNNIYKIKAYFSQNSYSYGTYLTPSLNHKIQVSFQRI